MAEEFSAQGKNFLITGGATGLGAVYVERFLKLGAGKVAILDIAEEAAKEFIKILNETYTDKVIFIKCDVSKEEEISKSFEEVLARFNKIDVVINNAGVMNDSPDVWRIATDINWQGLVSFTLKGIKHMRKDEGGSGGTIINISSVAALRKLGMLPIYCGSKAAVLHFGRCISSPEFNDSTGIRVLTLTLGPTATPLMTNIPEKSFDRKLSLPILTTIEHPNEQSLESASNAVLKMFSKGAPGSIWYSTDDHPAMDITSIVDKAYMPLQKLLVPESFEILKNK